VVKKVAKGNTRRQRLVASGELTERKSAADLRRAVIEEAGFIERDFSGKTPLWAYGVAATVVGLSLLVSRHLSR